MGPDPKESTTIESANGATHLPARLSLLRGKLRQHIGSLAVGAIVLFCALLRLRLLPVPLERDEGEYAYAGQLLLKGMPVYLHVHSMKFPGSYVAYALSMALFGQTAAGIHFGLLIVNASTVILVYVLAKRVLSGNGAIVAAFSFGLLSLGRPVLGMFFHTENLVILFAMWGLVELLKAIERDRTVRFVLSGLLLGLATLMKQPGAFYFAFGCIYVLWAGLKESRVSARGIGTRLGALVVGAAIPLSVTGLLLVLSGTWRPFWFWTFRYAATYATWKPLLQGLASFPDQFSAIFWASVPLWILAGVGVIALFTGRESKETRAFIGGLSVFSLLALCPGFYFRDHYFLLVLPAASLLIGGSIEFLRRLMGRAGLHARAGAIAMVVFVTAFAICLVLQRFVLFEIEADKMSRWIYGPNMFPEAMEIARYIKSQTSPSDQIAVLGSEPEIYFYSDRLGATGYIYAYEMERIQPFAHQMQEEMIKEIEAARPAILVYVGILGSWRREPDSDNTIFEWMGKYGEANYQLAGAVEILSPDLTEFHWDEPEFAHYQLRDESGHLAWPRVPTVLILKRKDRGGS